MGQHSGLDYTDKVVLITGGTKGIGAGDLHGLRCA